MTQRRLLASNRIVDGDGYMDQVFRSWAGLVADSLPITGEGSPEGVVIAPQFSLYLDVLGAAGSIQYRKMLPSVSGDKSKGWLAV